MSINLENMKKTLAANRKVFLFEKYLASRSEEHNRSFFVLEISSRLPAIYDKTNMPYYSVRYCDRLGRIMYRMVAEIYIKESCRRISPKKAYQLCPQIMVS